jgi:preprotein translocase subunit SecA
MFKINHEGIPNSEDLNLNENERIVDEDVFRSIVSRIEQLEESASDSGCNNQITSSNTPEINIENHPFVVELNKKINAQQTSIYELKDMILKMQNFAMETSTSLKALVEQYESDKLYESQELLYNIDNNFVEGENLEPSEVIEEVTQLSNLNKEDLEEMLKNELSEEF